MKRLLFVTLVLMASLFKVLAMNEEGAPTAPPSAIAQIPATTVHTATASEEFSETLEAQAFISAMCEGFGAGVVGIPNLNKDGKFTVDGAVAVSCPPPPAPAATVKPAPKKPAKVASR